MRHAFNFERSNGERSIPKEAGLTVEQKERLKSNLNRIHSLGCFTATKMSNVSKSITLNEYVSHFFVIVVFVAAAAKL